MTSGAAKGSIYPITDTPAVPTYHYLRCDGNNLYADGIRAGDSFMVFYDLANLQAHTHDGVNSAGIEAPNSLAGNYVEVNGNAPTSSGAQQVGPTGYTYQRKLAWKMGRGGIFRVKVSLSATSGGTKSAIFGLNGEPIGSHMEVTATGGQSYEVSTQDLSGIQAGDLLEFYAYAHALINDTWTVKVMTDNPAYDPKPLLSSEL
jgi:hypothetical protein